MVPADWTLLLPDIYVILLWSRALHEKPRVAPETANIFLEHEGSLPF
jgi:hypothetical protein